MISQTWYVLTVEDGHQYRVFIHYFMGGGKVQIQGLDLYSMQNVYKGFWPNSTMPRKVLKFAAMCVERERIEG